MCFFGSTETVVQTSYDSVYHTQIDDDSKEEELVLFIYSIRKLYNMRNFNEIPQSKFFIEKF